MDKQNNNLNLEDHKKLVDYAFEKSREQVKWTLTRILPAALIFVIALYIAIYFAIKYFILK
jgi:hypothetical protein